jgi:putative transcriptional regulator
LHSPITCHIIRPFVLSQILGKARGRALSEQDKSKLVKQLRERLGLTQEKFAARLGVSFPTINRWENARSIPSPLALQRIEQILREMKTRGKDLLDEHFPESEL